MTTGVCTSVLRKRVTVSRTSERYDLLMLALRELRWYMAL